MKKIITGAAVIGGAIVTGYAATRDIRVSCQDLLKKPKLAQSYSSSHGEEVLDACIKSCPEREITFKYNGEVSYSSGTWSDGVPVCEK